MNFSLPMTMFTVTALMYNSSASQEKPTSTNKYDVNDVTSTSDVTESAVTDKEEEFPWGGGGGHQWGKGGGFSLKDHLRGAKPIRDYGIITMGVIGLPSNACSLLLMNRKRFRVTSIGVYFSALAVADSWVLFNYLTFQWSSSVFGTMIWSHHNFLCTLNHWSMLCALMWASWLMMALTVERLLVTAFPLKGKLWCTRRNAIVTVLSLFFFCAAFYGVLVFIWGVEMTNKCSNRKLTEFLMDYGYPFSLGLQTVGPAAVLVLLNAALVYQLRKAQKQREMMSKAGSLEGDAANEKRVSNTLRATITACVVSITFFLLTIPTGIIQVFNVMGLTQDEAHIKASEMSICIRCINHSINFYLYLLTSDRMRQEFWALITCQNLRRTKKNEGGKVRGIALKKGSTVQTDKTVVPSSSSK